MTGPIVWCFALYVFFLVLFGAAYYRLYLKQKSRFLFGVDLAASQRQSLQAAAERLIRGLQTTQVALPAMLNAVRSGNSLADLAEKSEKTVYSIGSSFRLYKSLIGIPDPSKLRRGPPRGVTLVCVEVLDLEGGVLLREKLMSISPRSQSDEEAIQAHLNSAPDRIRKARDELTALQSPEARIWSFWDFLYFSVVCQTTVGFGDILPNSTAVRLVVALQIVSGYAILVVLLNILLTR